MEALPLEYALKTVNKYGCSTCWGELEMKLDIKTGMYIVDCKSCKEETRGYVTKYYIERRRSESIGEERDVRRMLVKQHILPDRSAGKTNSELIHELGF